MARRALMGIVMMLVLLAGLTLRPDDGTPYSVTPPDAASSVSGTSHAKPLPRTPSVVGLMSSAVLALAGLLFAVRSSGVAPMPTRAEGSLRPDMLFSVTRARRGPPVLA